MGWPFEQLVHSKILSCSLFQVRACNGERTLLAEEGGRADHPEEASFHWIRLDQLEGVDMEEKSGTGESEQEIHICSREERNQLEMEVTQCTMVTQAVVSTEEGDQDQKPTHHELGLANEENREAGSLGKSYPVMSQHTESEMCDKEVVVHSDFFPFGNEEGCHHDHGNGGQVDLELVNGQVDEVGGGQVNWLPLPRVLLCTPHQLRDKEKIGNNNNTQSHCDSYNVRYQSCQPRQDGPCLQCATHGRRLDVRRREKAGTTILDREPLTVVRGLTHSLLELPTFLSQAPVALGSVCSLPPPPSRRTPPPPSPPRYACLSDRLKDYQLPSNVKRTTNTRRSQWTIMCVAFAFFCTCLGLVGTMLSFTSDYQDQAIIQMLHQINKSRHESIQRGSYQ